MASFPGSVKSFTTKLDGAGNPINAAHINDLQDEVNAIEDGYVNGTARLNSSNSTLANMVVTGGSTLATLSVSGASTFAVRPLAPPPHMALVFADSTAVIASSAASTLTWLSQSILTNSSMHSTATNPERLIPQTTGVYQFSAGLFVNVASALTERAISIRDSSGSTIATFSEKSTEARRAFVSGYKRYDAVGGYAVAVFLTDGASTYSLSTGVGNTWFSMVKL